MPGVYTIRAGVTLVEDSTAADSRDAASTITISALTYGVSITAFDVPSGPATQGYVVDADVTVENLGSVTAMFTVTLFDQPADGPEQAAVHETVEIAAAASKTVTLSWDTSDATPGVHTFRAGVTLVDDTDVSDSRDSAATITVSPPPPYAVAVTAVDVPAGPVTQGDTVEVDVTVENEGTSDANAKITLLYVPADGQPGIAAQKTVAIAAGATETVTLSWDTSDATPGVYTIRAGVTLVEDGNAADSMDAASTITIGPPTYGVSITAFGVPSGPATQGYVVDADVTVENLGSVAAMFKVTLFDQPADGPEQAAVHETVEIAAAASKTVTLSWDTSDAIPGAHTFRAGVTLVEDANVSDSRDSAATITISPPPPYTVAVTAVDVPAGPVTQGDTVEVDVTVENEGTSDANAVVTLLYIPTDGQPGIAAAETAAIAAGESETITLPWNTSPATPGTHNVRASVTLVEDTNAAGFRDAASTITIIAPTYGVAIKSVDTPTGPATQGDVVEVLVSFENTSSVTAMFEVTLFYQLADGPEVSVAEETVETTPGFTKGLDLSWDTSGASPGVYTIRAEVMLVGVAGVDDVDASRVAKTPFTIRAPVTYGVSVTAVDVPDVAVAQGETVDVGVTIENRSSVPAMFAVTLFYQPDDGQANGQELTAAEETIEIAAGATETVTLNWDTSDATPGVYKVGAKAMLVGVAGVEDVTDSLVAATPITVSAPVTYGVAITGIDVPAGPAALGAEVAVDVTVENLGNTEVNAKVTLLYQPDRGQGGTADEKTVQIVPGASVTITLSWDTSGVTPGVHTMRAGVTLVEDSDARDFLDSASTITVVSGRIILGDDRGLGIPTHLSAARWQQRPSRRRRR